MTNYENRNLRFAVIGSGHIGKRHAEMIRRNPEAELLALCDVKPASALNLKEYSDIPFFNSVDEMLNALPDIDVVSVCSPNGLHAEHSLKALEFRKHVVCEKPMAITKADCEKIIYKALQVSRHVFGVMQNRYSPPSAWLKEIVEKKLMGEIYMVQLNCFWNRDDRYYKADTWKGSSNLDGGTLFTQFSHFIDIMYWVFGDITDINGVFADFNHKETTAFEDSGLVNFRFVNGGMGSLNYSTSVWDTNLESSITVIGSKGSIKIGGQYMNEVVYCHIDGYELPHLPPVNPANDYGAYKGSAANHHYIIENVIDTLKGRNTMTTNALEGLKVVEIIERIYSLRKLNKPEIRYPNV
ncbi:Gfo/Idh/MocA family oxidoreductase [soil metagenome]